LKVLFAAVEMSPLAKVGGLGDVAGSLPRALRALGADVRVAMPMHAGIERESLHPTRVLQGVRVPWAGSEQLVDVRQADVRGVPVYLLENGRFFDRPRVYGGDDDRERFLFYCDALLAAAPHLDFRPDVVHAQDWHAALLLARLAAAPRHPWSGGGRVFTIHNLALRGDFDDRFARDHDIDAASLAVPGGVAPDLAFSAMAQGILHADRVNTVSQTYAAEILTAAYGAGLDPLLRSRADVVSGIVNGIDYEEFDPATDPAITRNYSVDTLELRADDKVTLQSEAGLPVSAQTMLCGVVTRLFAQKGIDLVAGAFDRLLAAHDVQLVVLGTGDAEVEDMLSRLQAAYPSKVNVWLEFNPALGQRVYAGCDVFLMPSRYEPCGLGQLISLRYGAVPLVRRTGGLADTVQDAGPSPGSGTGFLFDDASAPALAGTVERALRAYVDHAAWRAIQQRGMRQDWSWRRAAPQYLALYGLAIADRRRVAEEWPA